MAAGAVVQLVVPSPSWPVSFRPQDQTLPSLLAASEKTMPPPATVATSVRPTTCAGVLCAVSDEPTPREPNAFKPQAQTVPSDLTARECAPPAATAPVNQYGATAVPPVGDPETQALTFRIVL